jgi:HSF-type DNA-binding
VLLQTTFLLANVSLQSIISFLHRWFIYAKYSSFQRQLNIYGFKRITKGVDKHSYYHTCFLRGHDHLIHTINRVPLKNDDPSRLLTTSSAPDFYALNPLSESGAAASSFINPRIRSRSRSTNEEFENTNHHEAIPYSTVSIAQQLSPAGMSFDHRSHVHQNTNHQLSNVRLGQNTNTLFMPSPHSVQNIPTTTPHLSTNESFLTLLQRVISTLSSRNEALLPYQEHRYDRILPAPTGANAATTLPFLQGNLSHIPPIRSTSEQHDSIRSQLPRERNVNVIPSLSLLNPSILTRLETEQNHRSQDLQTLLSTTNIAQMLQREQRLRAIQSVIDTVTNNTSLSSSSTLEAANRWNLIQQQFNRSNDEQMNMSRHASRSIQSADHSIHVPESLLLPVGRTPVVVNNTNRSRNDPSNSISSHLLSSNGTNNYEATGTISSNDISTIVDALLLRNHLRNQQ